MPGSPVLHTIQANAPGWQKFTAWAPAEVVAELYHQWTEHQIPPGEMFRAWMHAHRALGSRSGRPE